MPSTSYDEVPYESYPFTQTHPDRLATVATLLGLKPSPVGRCRVLELGCAAGGNLIAMALTLPESRFAGIDLSSRQVADGQELIEALGLKNIELKHQSLLDVNAGLSGFDYILCHGVYSWVPAAVQNKILDICKQHLNSNRIAYISYNTYPVWHIRGMIGEMVTRGELTVKQDEEPVTDLEWVRIKIVEKINQPLASRPFAFVSVDPHETPPREKVKTLEGN